MPISLEMFKVFGTGLRIALLGAVCLVTPARADDAAPAPTPHRSFSLGYNQGWFGNAYGASWMSGFRQTEAREMLQLAARGGARTLRMWLLEGKTPEGLIWEGARAKGIDPRYLAKLDRFLEMAHEEGVKIAFALFNGNMPAEIEDLLKQAKTPKAKRQAEQIKQRWVDIFNEQNGAGVAFRQNVLMPLLDVMQRHESTVVLIDLVNEIDALTGKGFHTTPFLQGWKSAAAFACRWHQVIHDYGVETPVTVSLGWPGLLTQWSSGEDDLLAGRIPHACMDVFVTHLYNDRGDVPRCKDLQRLRARSGKPLILGEFGQGVLNRRYDDKFQARLTERFVRNAYRCGFDAAWAWRLKDERPGENPEARYSYWAFGKPRPAFETIKKLSDELSHRASP